MSHRFFINKIINEEAEIKGEDFSHIVKVLRFKKGDIVNVFNYEYGEYEAEIEEIDKNKKIIKVKIKNKIKHREKQDIKIIAIISLIKKEKWEFLLEKLTELGVNLIIPYKANRSVVNIKDFEQKRQRWEKIIYSAVKQCGRLTKPEIGNVIDDLGKINFSDDSLKFFIWEKEEKLFLIDEVFKMNKNKVKEVCFIIGPEGGFDDSEAIKIKSLGFLPVSLGDTILRVETATIAVASTLVQALRRSKWKNSQIN